MIIHEIRNNSELTLKLEGRLDTVTAPQLEELLKKNLPSIDTLELDFEKLEYISSAGLRVLLFAHKSLVGRGDMVITHVNELIQEVFDVTGFAEILHVM